MSTAPAEQNGDVAESLRQFCRCCFDLDGEVAIANNNTREIRVDPDDRIVVISRLAQNIEQSANSGCQSCCIILKALVFFGWDPNNDHTNKISLRFPFGIGNFELKFKLLGSEEYIQFYTPLDHGKAWRSIQPLPEICKDHLSIQSLSFIKACLKTCLTSHHDLCLKNADRLPTRLLDIGTRGQEVIRLVDAKDIESPKYIALSYCWGKSTPMRTTLDTLSMMKDGIQVSELTQAYTDAVVLARELDVQYLWIDALCIIQDFHQDWERESAMMGDIYSNALLTIAASSSKSAMEPFLRRPHHSAMRTHEKNSKVLTEVIGAGDNQVLLKARIISEEGAHWRWRNDAEQRQLLEPLSQRGWTLQEQLLSGRFLSISSTELQWTCNEAVFCECHSRLNHRREFGHMPISQISKPEQALRFWHKVIENYSKRLLTRPDDKLPAISAIANVLQRKTGFKYAAGLWAENIDLDLLWRRTGPLFELPNAKFIAPTFSWASVNGEVDYYCFRNGKDPYRKAAEVLAVEAAGNQNAPLGRVETGKLTVRGPLSPGNLRYIDADGGGLVVRMGHLQLEVVADTLLQEVMVQDPGGSLIKTACRWNPWKMGQDKSDNAAMEISAGQHENDDPVKNIFDPATQCWVLRLGAFSMTRSHREHELMILGKSPTEPDVYQRLGLGSCEDDGKVKLFETENVTTITLV